IQQAEQLRTSVINALGIDFNRRVLSAKVQQSLPMDGYRIDVVRLEVIPGFYLPVNVYVPTQTGKRAVPLVISIPGCNSSVYTSYIQTMSANLAKLGMVVVVPEGFCINGARAYFDRNEHLIYASELLALPGKTEQFLQELVSTVTWALDAYPMI